MTKEILVEQVNIEIQKLSSTAVVPKYETALAAGMDLCADIEATIKPGDWRLIPTNIAIALPPGFEAQVRPRSGLALKKGITVLNSPGTVDADYRGGIGVILMNHSKEHFAVKPGDRIAQLVIARHVQADFLEVMELSKTARGTGGFGSTGK